MTRLGIDRRRAVTCLGGAVIALIGGTALGCAPGSAAPAGSDGAVQITEDGAADGGPADPSQPDPDAPTSELSPISEALANGPSIWFCSSGEAIDESAPISSVRAVEDGLMTTYLLPAGSMALGDFASMSDPEIIDLARAAHADNLKAKIEDAKARARGAVGTGQVDPVLQRRADALAAALDGLALGDPEPQAFSLSVEVDDTGAVSAETLDVAVQSLSPLPDINSTDGSWDALLDGLSVAYDEHLTSVFAATDESGTGTSGGVAYAGYPALFAMASKTYGGLALDEAESSGPIALP